jgi:hypothetical protein
MHRYFIYIMLDRNKDSFNFLLSAMRQCIFGMFVGRWGIFRRRLTCGAQKWGLDLGACAKLHNYCIRQGEDKPLPPMEMDVLAWDK